MPYLTTCTRFISIINIFRRGATIPSLACCNIQWVVRAIEQFLKIELFYNKDFMFDETSTCCVVNTKHFVVPLLDLTLPLSTDLCSPEDHKDHYVRRRIISNTFYHLHNNSQIVNKTRKCFQVSMMQSHWGSKQRVKQFLSPNLIY